MPIIPRNDVESNREDTQQDLVSAIVGLTGTLANDSTLQQGLTELQDLLIALNANINDGVPMTPADLSALESITATIIGLPSDYPDADTHTKLDEIKDLLAALPTSTGDATAANQVLSNTKLDTLHSDNGLATTSPPSSGAGILGWLRGIYDVVSALPTTTGLTDTQLRATPVPISGTVTATTGGLTDSELRAAPVPVSGTVTATGPLTDTQLRATAVPVSDGGGSITVDGTIAVSNPGLTDAQLRASAVPVSGTVTATGPLTDTQLRATAVSVTDTRTDYPSTGANTKLDTLHADITSSNTKLDTVHTDLGSVPGFITPPIGSGAIAWLYGIYDTVSNILTKDNDRTYVTANNITARDTGSTETTSASGDVVITGTPTANSYQSFSLLRDQGARILVTGTFTGTLVVETSLDATTWIRSVLYQEDGTRVSSFTAPIAGMVQTSGAQYIRVRATTAWTGTAIVNLVGSVGQSVVNGVDKSQLGSATTSPPTSGVGIIGWLRGIYDKVAALPTTIGLTDTQLRATPVPVSGTVTATTGGLTDTQLRATPVPVSGTVTATTGGLTDTQLRATAVPVSGTVTASGPLTDAQLRASAVPVSGTVMATTGGLTDTQLRATPVPVSGTITATGPLTDTQLRATAVPVSGTVTATGDPDVVTTGNVTADDGVSVETTYGTGLVKVTGTPTANSVQQVTLDRDKTVVVSVGGTWSAGFLNFEVSLDGTTWWKIYGYTNGGAKFQVIAAPSQAVLTFNTSGWTYFRVRGTSGTTGTAALTMSRSPGDSPNTWAGVTTDAVPAQREDLVAGNGDYGTPLLAVRNDAAAAKTDTNGDYSMLAVDSAGRVGIADLGGSITVDGAVTATDNVTQLAGTAIDVNSGNKSAGTQRIVVATDQPQLTTPLNTENRYSYSNLLALATTTVKGSPGVLHGIMINKKGVTANTLTIWDNTAASGTKIATIDTVNAPIGILLFDVVFTTGLTVVLAAGTAADITVIYR